MQPKPVAAAVFNIMDIEHKIGEALQQRPETEAPEARVIDYAPPKARLPGYVEHRDGVGEIGKLSAEAVVKEYESAALAVETMGAELKERLAKLETTKAEAIAAIAEIKETAESYRNEGKRIFLQIEDCSLMTSEVRATCGALKGKIAGPSS